MGANELKQHTEGKPCNLAVFRSCWRHGNHLAAHQFDPLLTQRHPLQLFCGDRHCCAGHTFIPPRRVEEPRTGSPGYALHGVYNAQRSTFNVQHYSTFNIVQRSNVQPSTL
jgi:hypothetical protein